MRAYLQTSPLSPPHIAEVPVPTPQAHEILVEIDACGLNFADTLMLKNQYQDMPPHPLVPGLEIAGTVVAHGSATQTPAIGARVAVVGGHGGLAQFGCFAAKRAVVLPEGMSSIDAAALQIAYGTSHVALDYKARLKPDETLLVLGAAGGVGLTAVEIGKLMGARVIACARGKDKLAIAKQAGADHLVESETDDLTAIVKSLGGADVVYDPVGGALFKQAMRACNPEARLLAIGFASGEIPQIPANHLLVKNLSVTGFYWGGYLDFRPEIITQSLQTLFDWYGLGRIKPHISHVLPLDQAEQGLDLLRNRLSTGKVVITPNNPRPAGTPAS